MPKLNRRRNAALKGWKTRNEKRSQPKTKHYEGATVPKLPDDGIIRTKYAKTDIEIRRKNGRTVEIRIKGKRYTRPVYLRRFDALVSASVGASERLSRGNRKRNSRKR